jgi:hypothetical protein
VNGVEISERDLERLYAWRMNCIEELGFTGVNADPAGNEDARCITCTT